MTQISAPWISRIWLVVFLISPQKIELCWAMSSAAKLTPNTIPKYFALSPISILSATQFMTSPSAGTMRARPRSSCMAMQRCCSRQLERSALRLVLGLATNRWLSWLGQSQSRQCEADDVIGHKVHIKSVNSFLPEDQFRHRTILAVEKDLPDDAEPCRQKFPL